MKPNPESRKPSQQLEHSARRRSGDGRKNGDGIKELRSLAEVKMERCLERLSIPLKVVWKNDVYNGKHGEIKSDCLFIYDADEQEAWITFEHEVFEFKLNEVTQVYRTFLNSLIEGIEKLHYERKERFLEILPRICTAVAEEKNRKG